MRIVKWSLAAVAILVAAVIVIGLMLPRQVSVMRTIDITAPAGAIFPHVNSLRATAAWSPWLDRDPDVQVIYSGPDSGVGARMVWTSDNPQVGSGTQEIVASVENARVETALDFGDMGTAGARFDLTGTDAGTSVTWGLDTDMGAGPIGRWMGLMMDKWVGADYEAGLANLKALVER